MLQKKPYGLSGMGVGRKGPLRLNLHRQAAILGLEEVRRLQSLPVTNIVPWLQQCSSPSVSALSGPQCQTEYSLVPFSSSISASYYIGNQGKKFFFPKCSRVISKVICLSTSPTKIYVNANLAIGRKLLIMSRPEGLRLYTIEPELE